MGRARAAQTVDAKTELTFLIEAFMTIMTHFLTKLIRVQVKKEIVYVPETIVTASRFSETNHLRLHTRISFVRLSSRCVRKVRQPR